MNKTLLGAAVGLALSSGAAQAALIDFDGTGAAVGTLDVVAVDWSPTSFLALGGQTAINNFIAGFGPTTFDVLTHASLATEVTLADESTTNVPGLNSSYQITMVARFQETVTSVVGSRASFATTGAGGFLEIYFDSTPDSVAVSGSGFNDGQLILRGTIVPAGITGGFEVLGGPVVLDQSGGNNYGFGIVAPFSQLTVTGRGDNENLEVGGLTQDFDFFKDTLASFGLSFANISLALPFVSVNPSDCFTGVSSGIAIGASTAAYDCTPVHADAPYAGQGADGLGGIVPVVGPVNGFLALASIAPDFVAQTDYNGSFTAAVPEPTTIALLGLSLAAMGFKQRRRG